jgi:hypothetical protein
MHFHEFWCGSQPAFAPRGATRNAGVTALTRVLSGAEAIWTERVRLKVFETRGARLAQIWTGMLRPVTGAARMPVCGSYRAGEVI